MNLILANNEIGVNSKGSYKRLLANSLHDVVVFVMSLLAGPASNSSSTSPLPPDVSQIGAKPASQLFRGVNPYKSAAMAEPKKSSSSPVSMSSASSAEQILRQIKQHRQQQEQDLHEFAQSLVEDVQGLTIATDVPLSRGPLNHSHHQYSPNYQYQQPYHSQLQHSGSGSHGGSSGSSEGRTKYLQYHQQQMAAAAAVAQANQQHHLDHQLQQEHVNQSKNDKNAKGTRNSRRLGRHESRYTSGNYTKT